jgi:hypothetical protein
MSQTDHRARSSAVQMPTIGRRGPAGAPASDAGGVSVMAAGYRRAGGGTRPASVGGSGGLPQRRPERPPRGPEGVYGERMIVASYVIVAILLLGATVLAAGLLAGLLLAVKAMDRGPGAP